MLASRTSTLTNGIFTVTVDVTPQAAPCLVGRALPIGWMIILIPCLSFGNSRAKKRIEWRDTAPRSVSCRTTILPLSRALMLLYDTLYLTRDIVLAQLAVIFGE